MKINLMYIIINEGASNWSIYGPELYQNNIYIFTTGYRALPTESACIDKMDEMLSSLGSVISNITERYVVNFSNFSIRFSEGDLNVSSDVPDYTQILTSINSNLTDLNGKFVTNANNQQGANITSLLSNIFQYNNGASSMRASNSIDDSQKNYANIILGLWDLLKMFYNSSSFPYSGTVLNDNKFLNIINKKLVQSVSPNASITDVLTSLNSNIHNDLTNINTTENNKDTVLIIDGQQEFKLHKDDE